MADDDKTRQVNVPTEGTPSTQAGATEAATQAGPPPAPNAPKAPKAPGGGMTLPTPAVVGGAIVLVAALVFGIFMFMGKSSADDDKKKLEDDKTALTRENREQATEIEAANEEIAELEDQNASLSEQLGQSEEFAAALDQVLGAGTTAADSLYECAVTAYEFVLNSLNSGVPDVGQAQAVDDRCLSAEDNYNAFNAAINDLAEA
jgi:septal ring factor EnvC (AmiA/AmiB activator)